MSRRLLLVTLLVFVPFTTLIRPRRTAFYRALVRRSSACQGAASERERVAVIRSRRR